MANLDVTADALPSGFEFGAYVVGSCIGQGGMARIYRAEHRALRKPVALKVMENALLERPDGRSRFLREGQAAAAVKHPNVVDITDVGVWQGRPYLVMELLEGEDLEQYLARHKPLAEADVARLIIPVIAGLARAHGCGVIHRDLKPSNVFLARGPDGDTVPKLLDFGISKLANALQNLDLSATPLGQLMGSPMYMSPEAVRGGRDLTPQSDQYSLGVVLYECVTGRPPFSGDSLLGVLEAVARGKFEPPRRFRPDLSPTLEGAILRAMSREPSQRFATVRELGRALCEAADHRTRLLWTPSFGLRDWAFDGDTAPLGPSPLKTGSPLTTSLHKRSVRSYAGRAAWLGAAALAALGTGFFLQARITWFVPPETRDAAGRAGVDDAVAADDVVAADPAAPPLNPSPRVPLPAAPSTERLLSEASSLLPAPPVADAPVPRVAPAGNAAAAGARPRPAQDERRAQGPRMSRDAPGSTLGTAPAREEKGELPATDSPRSVAPSRAAPALGANQSPILD